METPAWSEIYLMSDSEKLAHTIRMIIQNFGTVQVGKLNDLNLTADQAACLRLVIAAFSAPFPVPVGIPPLLSWFSQMTKIPLLVIADQPTAREMIGRSAQYLKYPFDTQALCDMVMAVLESNHKE